ncbi:MAG: cytochrome b/b6 domain-containing protein, partial [Pseudomonadota bacterium]|nr:cytochrome b/b6 domain-containing protein [Pseudomonadota bacterium]
MRSAPLVTVRVWDLPTRCFHWLLTAAVTGSVVSAWLGGDAMVWHFRLGYTVFTLLAFRVVWGCIGGHWSRFHRFLYGPAALYRYLRGASLPGEQHDVGHSPLGALSVFALLAVLALQVGTGLVADDEVANTGPLQPLVSNATSLSLTHWHRSAGQWAVIGLVGLHVGAIAYYLLVRRRRLVRPMVFGDKLLDRPAPSTVDNARTRFIALVVLVACASLVWWVSG